MRTLIDVLAERAKANANNDQEDWERIRWLASVGLTPHLKKGVNMKPSDLIKFSWEVKKEKEKAVTDKAKRAEKWAKWDADMAKKYKNG